MQDSSRICLLSRIKDKFEQNTSINPLKHGPDGFCPRLPICTGKDLAKLGELLESDLIRHPHSVEGEAANHFMA